MNFFEAFAGIGGFRIGLERVGFKCIGSCEIDKYASKLYRSYFDTKGEFYEEDIRNIKCDKLPDFELLVGGFPCQTFSKSGNQRGFNDERGLLFFELARIAKFKKPEFLFFENVKNLLSHDGGKTFEKILIELWELGYDVEYATLNSKDFGLPQNRERVFIIGHLREKSRREILPVLKNLKTARYGNATSGGTYVVENRLTPKRLGFFKKGRQGERVFDANFLSVCLRASSYDFYKIGNKIRKLTPLECFRLQGFSDEMFQLAKELKISDSQLYKMAGNAVSVNVIEAIAKQLQSRFYNKRKLIKRSKNE